MVYLMSAVFWTISSPELSTVLHFAPNLGEEKPYDIRIFSPKGEEYQRLQMVPSGQGASSVELNNILSELLPDRGIRHASIEVDGVEPGGVLLRLIGPSGHMLASPLKEINNKDPFFMPKTFPKSGNSYLAILNTAAEDKEVAVKLMIPGRAPELMFNLKARETRLMHLQTEFSDVVEMTRRNKIPGYIRIKAKGDQGVSAALLDQSILDSGVCFRMVAP